MEKLTIVWKISKKQYMEFNMKYTIEGFNQEEMFKLGMDCADACILRWFVDFLQTKKMCKLEYKNEIYYWIKYEYLIKEMPLIRILNHEALSRRLQKMSVFQHHLFRNGGGAFAGYRLDEKIYETLISQPTETSVATDLNIGTKNPSINNPSNNIINNKGCKHPKQQYSNKHIIPEVMQLIEKYTPVDKTKPPTKTYISMQRFLVALKEHTIQQDYSFDEKWAKYYDIDFEYIDKISSYDGIGRTIKMALQNMEKAKQVGYRPVDKNTLPKTFANFLYNPYTRKSWFLCFLNPPKPIQQTHLDKAAASLPEKTRKTAEEYLKQHHPDWPINEFLSKLAYYRKWFEKNQEKVFESCPGLKFEGGPVKVILERFSEFEAGFTNGQNDFTVYAFDMNGKVWKEWFVRWYFKEYGVNLNVGRG
jgi:hypothetical protein